MSGLILYTVSISQASAFQVAQAGLLNQPRMQEFLSACVDK